MKILCACMGYFRNCVNNLFREIIEGTAQFKKVLALEPIFTNLGNQYLQT